MTITDHDPAPRWARLSSLYGRAPVRYPSGRRCADPGCGVILSVYNSGPLCCACGVGIRTRAAASSGDAVAAMTAPLPAPLPTRPVGPPLRAPRGTDGVTRAKVLALLPVGEIVTGTSIATRLGLARSVVSKHVRQLRRCGHVIESRGGACGGYRRIS